MAPRGSRPGEQVFEPVCLSTQHEPSPPSWTTLSVCLQHISLSRIRPVKERNPRERGDPLKSLVQH